MNKNEFKTLNHKAPHNIRGFNTFVIKKQKYICKNCNKTALAELSDINKSDNILRIVKASAARFASNVSIKYIASTWGIS